MKKNLFQVPVISDPGSEAAVGFDYQFHVATGICIKMLTDKQVQYILCEFHEDVVQVRQDDKLEMVQIKKRERGKWSLNDLIKPERSQKLGILGKLFKCIQDGKDVCKLRLVGHGGTTGNDECSLPGLVALLTVPLPQRDDEWESKFQVYVDYLADILKPQGIERNTVVDGLKLLEIDFHLGHPDAIKQKNCTILANVVRTIWNVELTMDEVDEIYNELYRHVHELALKPQNTWKEKALSREAALIIVDDCIRKYAPSASRRELLTTQQKLTVVGLDNKVIHALQLRSTAMYLRFEISIDSISWEDLRTEIDKKWRELSLNHPGLEGPTMWGSMRNLFKELGESWSAQDKRMGAEFVEGVFFDMTGTCDVDWKLATNG